MAQDFTIRMTNQDEWSWPVAIELDHPLRAWRAILGASLASVLILIGELLFRFCFLKAGVYVPFPLG
jgi:hypothetical protein